VGLAVTLDADNVPVNVSPANVGESVVATPWFSE